MTRPVISVDGGGVVPDRPLIDGGPLPDGYRFRVSLTDRPDEDLSLHITAGRLHVDGQYGTVHCERVTPNRVTLHAIPPRRRTS